MYNVIIPCVMLSTLTLTGFWMRPDSGEKVTLGLTVLLAFSVFMLLVAESMPATSSFVPLIGKRKSKVQMVKYSQLNNVVSIKTEDSDNFALSRSLCSFFEKTTIVLLTVCVDKDFSSSLYNMNLIGATYIRASKLSSHAS